MRRWWIGIFVLALALTACGGSDESTPANDTPELGEASPTAEEGAPATLPPTWTPAPQLQRTPGDSSAAKPPVLASPGPTWTPLPDWCNTLEAVETGGEVTPNHPVTVSWTQVPGINAYEVELRHDDGRILLTTRVEDVQYTFEARWFESEGVYNWQVVPLDQNNQKVCYGVGDEIIVREE